ncbi:hypothetical protein TSUD_402340 [Trifolium subterraneum]|uniref:RNase H type-1 domain-containing protein n=1 Tax=Trifolium subterraneum TaxID=3900 RepID=A0A2Z6PM30_TRISU|nr:hypothetical protein TSUD_402340 [Trifolium subterraneum]
MRIAHMMCDHCRVFEETSLHVLRDCDVAKEIWMVVVPRSVRSAFFGGDLSHWFSINLDGELVGINDINWPEFWATVCYFLWNWRNREYHDNSFTRPVQPVQVIMQRCREYKLAARASRVVTSVPRINVMIGWEPPSQGWVKLNTDGARKNERVAGCGGIIRNNIGDWIGGFAKHVGSCSAFVAELWGVLEGLNYAWKLGFKKVELEIDSAIVVDAVNSGETNSAMGIALIRSIRRIIALNWNVKVYHSYRESNLCADAFANLGCALDENIVFFDTCSSQIRNLLFADISGHTTLRLIPM